MATIGLDKIYYAKITEDAAGDETYEKPTPLSPAISAEMNVDINEAILYAEDGISENVKEFKSGTLTLGVKDIGNTAASDLTGAMIDKNGVVISHSESGGEPVAVGFRAQKPNGTYRYFWLYKVKFSIPGTNLKTKEDSITFSTPSIEGTIMRRNKLDEKGKHPWKAEANEGEVGVSDAIIGSWYNEVYEPTYETVSPASLEENGGAA